jgi:membrane protease YdiL (CAAX protease family)
MTSVAPAARPSALRRLISQHPLASLFILIYALEWLTMVPAALESQGLLPFHLPDILAFTTGWAPAIAAVIVTGAVSGKAGVRALFSRFLRWRVGIQWYVVALGGIAALILGGLGLYGALGNPVPALPIAGADLGSAVFAFVVTIAMGLLLNTEEIAWRGVALPRLQATHSALIASLLLAVVEGLTHLPYAWTAGTFVNTIGVAWFMGFSFALTIIYSWVFNNTKGSLLLVTLLHASQNTWANLLSPDAPGPFYVTAGLTWAVAIALVVIFGAARLSRKPAAETPDLVEPAQA